MAYRHLSSGSLRGHDGQISFYIFSLFATIDMATIMRTAAETGADRTLAFRLPPAPGTSSGIPVIRKERSPFSASTFSVSPFFESPEVLLKKSHARECIDGFGAWMRGQKNNTFSARDDAVRTHLQCIAAAVSECRKIFGDAVVDDMKAYLKKTVVDAITEMAVEDSQAVVARLRAEKNVDYTHYIGNAEALGKMHSSNISEELGTAMAALARANGTAAALQAA